MAERCISLSRKDKKAQGLEQHKKLQREKDLKRKMKKQVSLPAKHKKLLCLCSLPDNGFSTLLVRKVDLVFIRFKKLFRFF